MIQRIKTKPTIYERLSRCDAFVACAIVLMLCAACGIAEVLCILIGVGAK